MESPQVDSVVVRKLTAAFQAKKLTRIQIGIVALALLTLLYTVLWIALDRPAATVSAQDALPNATTAEVPTEAAAETSSEGAPAAGNGALSATFLGEYDRLSGASTSADAAESPVGVAAPGAPLNTVFVSLILVAGLAYAGVWGYKQVLLQRQGLPAMAAGKRLSVQETQSLGPNQRLHLVQLGDEVLLLGATEHTITCLARYGADYADDSFDAHLATAAKSKSAPTSPLQPLSLQESLESLRNVQHRQRGGDHA